MKNFEYEKCYDDRGNRLSFKYCDALYRHGKRKHPEDESKPMQTLLSTFRIVQSKRANTDVAVATVSPNGRESTISQNPNPTTSSVGFISPASHSRPCAFSKAARFLDQLATATSAALSRESSESAIQFVRHALQASQSLVRISLHLVNTCPTTDQVSSLPPAADRVSKALFLQVETCQVSSLLQWLLLEMRSEIYEGMFRRCCSVLSKLPPQRVLLTPRTQRQLLESHWHKLHRLSSCFHIPFQ